MSRRISNDFRGLHSFLKIYSLENYFDNVQQIEECKAMHKKLYGLMLFCGEFNLQNSKHPTSEFLDETVSDLMLCLFSWVHGMYKPSKLELRCAIENFIKAMLSVVSPDIVTVKNIYEIFEEAKGDLHFKPKKKEKCLLQLHNAYSTLCRTVHSDPLEINSIGSLKMLPQYDATISKAICSLFLECAENMLLILYSNYISVVDNMHPENKKDFLDCMAKKTKTLVNELLFN